MAEDQDKSQQTEEPTAKRLEQAREHGDAVKSSELSTFILLGGGTLAIAMFGKYTALGLASSLSYFLQQPDAISVDAGGLSAVADDDPALEPDRFDPPRGAEEARRPAGGDG